MPTPMAHRVAAVKDDTHNITLTGAQDPSEAVANGAVVSKLLAVSGGVNNVNTNFSEVNPLRVDGTGTQYTAVTNTVNVSPASSHAAGAALPVTVTDATVAMKIEDLSSSINADNASGTDRSVAVGLKAKTNITDASTGTFVKCDASGRLETVQNKTTTLAFDSVACSSGGASILSSAIELTGTSRGGVVSILVEFSSVSPGDILTEIQVGRTAGGTFYTLPLSFITEEDASSGGLAKFVTVKDISLRFIKLRVTNNNFSASSNITAAVYE